MSVRHASAHGTSPCVSLITWRETWLAWCRAWIHRLHAGRVAVLERGAERDGLTRRARLRLWLEEQGRDPATTPLSWIVDAVRDQGVASGAWTVEEAGELESQWKTYVTTVLQQQHGLRQALVSQEDFEQRWQCTRTLDNVFPAARASPGTVATSQWDNNLLWPLPPGSRVHEGAFREQLFWLSDSTMEVAASRERARQRQTQWRQARRKLQPPFELLQSLAVHVALGWATGLRACLLQREKALCRVHDGLVDSRSRTQVPATTMALALRELLPPLLETDLQAVWKQWKAQVSACNAGARHLRSASVFMATCRKAYEEHIVSRLARMVQLISQWCTREPPSAWHWLLVAAGASERRTCVMRSMYAFWDDSAACLAPVDRVAPKVEERLRAFGQHSRTADETHRGGPPSALRHTPWEAEWREWQLVWANASSIQHLLSWFEHLWPTTNDLTWEALDRAEGPSCTEGQRLNDSTHLGLVQRLLTSPGLPAAPDAVTRAWTDEATACTRARDDLLDEIFRFVRSRNGDLKDLRSRADANPLELLSVMESVPAQTVAALGEGLRAAPPDDPFRDPNAVSAWDDVRAPLVALLKQTLHQTGRCLDGLVDTFPMTKDWMTQLRRMSDGSHPPDFPVFLQCVSRWSALMVLSRYLIES